MKDKNSKHQLKERNFSSLRSKIRKVGYFFAVEILLAVIVFIAIQLSKVI